MIKLQELCDEQIGPSGFEILPSGHLKLRTKKFPWSVVQQEFDYLYNIIVDNKLTRGFEACTGVGISGLAAGLAMQQTGGKIVTLDAYIEESLETPDYDGHEPVLNHNAVAFDTVQALIVKYNLQNTLIPVVGWTPNNVPEHIEANFSQPLEYVFIDGGHTPNQVIQDIEVLLPYTDSNTFWLFHDAHDSVFNNDVKNYVMKKLGKTREIVCPASQGCNDLAILR
jgi:hypothetical protein